MHSAINGGFFIFYQKHKSNSYLIDMLYGIFGKLQQLRCLRDFYKNLRISTASFSSTVAIFDALMVGLMEEKDYPLSDFALIHPGGAVGKQICK